MVLDVSGFASGVNSGGMVRIEGKRKSRGSPQVYFFSSAIAFKWIKHLTVLFSNKA